MKDFVQHRIALTRAWADTDFIPLDYDGESVDFNEPIDLAHDDDVYSNVVWLVTFVLLFSICAAAFL